MIIILHPSSSSNSLIGIVSAQSILKLGSAIFLYFGKLRQIWNNSRVFSWFFSQEQKHFWVLNPWFSSQPFNIASNVPTSSSLGVRMTHPSPLNTRHPFKTMIWVCWKPRDHISMVYSSPIFDDKVISYLTSLEWGRRYSLSIPHLVKVQMMNTN